MIHLFSAVPWWDCLRWLTQLSQPGWYPYLQHLNWEISIPGTAQHVQGRVWRMGFTLLPTPYPVNELQDASGLFEILALLISLLCLSSRNLLLPWVHREPVTAGGENSHTRDVDEVPTEQRKVNVFVGMGFWRLSSCSPCLLARVFSPGWAMPLRSAFSVFCTDRCLMRRQRLWKAKFLHICQAVLGQLWASLSRFLLCFSDTHNCGCLCQI